VARLLAPGVSVHHRDELDALQRELREVPGCTVLIYDQTCATEKRRRRKRGTLAPASTHVVIHEAVCEGCGDCSVQSNCLSVEPVDTVMGRKRRINQHSCNQDLSCVKGFCPSLVTVQGQGGQAPRLKASLSAPAMPSRPDVSLMPTLPEPAVPAAPRPWGIVVAGIGGTGVITIGQLLGVAAHLEGKGVITQDSAGLAQKGGAAWSHIQIADRAEVLHTTRVPTAEADLIIACDAIVASQPATLSVMAKGRTRLALNTHGTPTATMVHQAQWQYPQAACAEVLDTAVGFDHIARLDAQQLAEGLLGDAIFANPLMLGFAWQKGWVPLSHAALRRAIELNEVQVERNLAAFEWGRQAAHELAAVQRLALPAQVVSFHKPAAQALNDLIEHHTAFLQAYQDVAWAQRYARTVQQVRQAEQALGSEALSRVVAEQLFKLMAYKDEYEVARLLSDPAFGQDVSQRYEGPVHLRYHLAPPWWPGALQDGRPRKITVGAWLGPVLGLLAHGKALRGTWLDPFGRSAERRQERELIERYEDTVQVILPRLNADSLNHALELARVSEPIRGYGPVKQAAVNAALPRWEALLRAWATDRA
jgi:indolepyruvate ferredoxin oxidoreductase